MRCGFSRRKVNRFGPAAVAAAGLLLCASAHREIETNLYVTYRLAEEHLQLEVDAANFLIEPLAGLKFEEALPEDLAPYRDALVVWLSENCPVKIDGIEVTPVIELLEFEKLFGAMHLADFRNLVMAYFVVNYPLKSPPGRLSLVWGTFVPEPPYGWGRIADPDQDPDAVSVQLKVYKKYSYFSLSPEEPEYVWRRAPDEPDLALATGVEPDPLRLPLWSLVFGGVALVGAGLSRRRPRQALGILASGAVSAGLLLAAPVELDRTVPALPTPERGVEVFGALLENVYRAFDYAEEDDIYDALARSVDGPLLGKTYRDIFNSLVLEDDGGVMCRVETVTVDAAEFLGPVDLPDSPARGYEVQAAWQVLGKVSHWGHTHERINKYGATCRLEPRGGQWRICDIDVTEQKRINPAARARTEPADSAGPDGGFDPTVPEL